MPLSSAAFQALDSNIPPVVLALIQNIEARKTPLVTPAQFKELAALSPKLPRAALAIMLVQLEWDMTLRPDEHGCQIKLNFTWSELSKVCSPEDLAALKHWEQERKKSLALDQLCDRCRQPMHGGIAKEEYSYLRPRQLFGLTPSGFKIFSYCDWCMEHFEESDESDVPLRVNRNAMSRVVLQ